MPGDLEQDRRDRDLLGTNSVAETLLIPLYCRALETQRPDAILRDPKAVELIRRLRYDPASIRLEQHDVVSIVLRTREFDRHARSFLTLHPQAAVVHIGCGLDTRFERVDNGQVEWYDLDLPAVIAVRRQLIGDGEGRYHLLAASVFESDWLDAVSVPGRRPTLFLAEGVLPYFPEAQIKALFQALRARFPGAELVCDVMTPFMIWANNWQFAFSKFKARLQWGLKDHRDVETWGDGIRLLDEWYYFDHPEPRMGGMQAMRYLPLVAKANAICRYRLGQPAS